LKKFLVAALLVVAVVLGFASPAHGGEGNPDNEGVCQPQSAHIKPPNNTTKSITITAPEGKLISGYCVKAGSIKQGNGPEYVTLNPPMASVTISHSSGKDISHYTVTFVDKPTVPEVTTTVPGGSNPVPTTVPESAIGTPQTFERTGVPVEELPVTGSNLFLAILGIGLIAFGYLVVRAVRT
jgi:hypothetical protein